jgi:hypothetical protein
MDQRSQDLPQDPLGVFLADVSAALTRLDADRLEALAADCERPGWERACTGRSAAEGRASVKEEHDVTTGLAVLERVLAATRRNLEVLGCLRGDSSDHRAYSCLLTGQWSKAEHVDGNH